MCSVCWIQYICAQDPLKNWEICGVNMCIAESFWFIIIIAITKIWPQKWSTWLPLAFYQNNIRSNLKHNLHIILLACARTNQTHAHPKYSTKFKVPKNVISWMLQNLQLIKKRMQRRRKRPTKKWKWQCKQNKKRGRWNLTASSKSTFSLFLSYSIFVFMFVRLFTTYKASSQLLSISTDFHP